MKYTHLSLEAGWQPKKIVGNLAYYINPDTGQTKTEYISNDQLSKKKKEFADWFKVHGKFRSPSKSGKKAILIRKKEYATLSRDPLAPFDFANISSRTGRVTKVLSANRLVIDDSYVVSVPGIKIPAKQDNYLEWDNARRFTESLIGGQQVYISINNNNPYAQNGDILASVEFTKSESELKNQQEEGWGIFDYLNISGYFVGSVAKNVEVWGRTGSYGTTTTGNRYSLSDTFTFTRLYHQLSGDAKTISLYGKGETEGAWYEKLAVDILGDPTNFISIEGKGISAFGKRLVKGSVYMKPLTRAATKTTDWANTYQSHIYAAGLGKSVDTLNRAWRRVNTLLEPAYYTVNTQLDIWNSTWLGGSNPMRLFDVRPIIRKANNPIFRKDTVIHVPGKPGYTAEEFKALVEEYRGFGKNAGIGDVVNPYKKSGLWDKAWDPLVRVASWQSDTTWMAMFMDGLKKGISPAEAAKRADKFLFNYDPKTLTAFEQAYIYRIYPYYLPQKKNIALQVEQALRTPYKYTSVAKWQIDQRRQAGKDQFKDYERNTIIQRVGDGKYIKIRFPMEDITQMPDKYGSAKKAFLSSTYPIYNMWPELYEDKNWFDETRPTGNYLRYMMKKWVGREYYAYRDFSNPNISIQDKVYKHVLGVGTITPDNRVDYAQALIDAGYSPSRALQEADATLRRQESFKSNSLRVLSKAQAQAAMPDELRDRPRGDADKLGFWAGGFWEKFQYPQFAMMAGLVNIRTRVQTGAWGNKGLYDRIHPSDILKELDKARPVLLNGLDKTFDDQWRDRKYFLADLLLDPLFVVGWAGKVGKAIQAGGRELYLSKEGQAVFAKLNPVVASGRAAGLYGKQAAARMMVEADAKFLKYLEKTPGSARIMTYTPGLRAFGQTVIHQQSFRAAYEVMKMPASASLKVAGLAAVKMAELANPITQPIKDKMVSWMIPSEKMKGKWMDDFQQRFGEYEELVRDFKRVASSQSKQMQAESLRKARVWQRAKEAHDTDPSHGYFWHLTKLSDETSTRLTDFVELGKKDPDLNGVIDDLTREFDNMARGEIDRKILTAYRQNYVYHLLTNAYRTKKGYIESAKNKLHIKAPFSIHRFGEGTIAEWNAETIDKFNIRKFEPNIFKILRVRKHQHIEAVETYDFLERLKDDYGIPQTYARFLQTTFGVSKEIPQWSNVLMPVDLIMAVERNSIIRSRIATFHSRPGKLRKALDSYDGFVSFYRRNIVMLNPKFLAKNTISSIHQNIQAGMYNINKYLPQKNRNGIAFVTESGRPIYTWELNEWYSKYKLTEQPGMAVAGTKAPIRATANAIDQAGTIPRWATTAMESLMRTRLFNQKIKEGLSPDQADAYVKAFHLDYLKAYSPAMEIAARFIMFPTWTTGAPFITARSVLERPWQYTTGAKMIDQWNDPASDIMLRYKPEYLNDKVLLKIPGTADTFFVPPMSTPELMKWPYILHTKEFQFYWGEALSNPNTLRVFARKHLDVDWLKRGGGTAKRVGNDIVITYGITGETITGHITSDGKLVFVDGNTNVVIKEFDTINTGNKTGIVTPGEPVAETIRNTAFPWFAYTAALFGTEKYKNQLQITGDAGTDSMITVLRLMGFGAIIQSILDANDEEVPWWTKYLEIFGDVHFAHLWPGMEKPGEPSKEKIRKSFRQVDGNYRGCGY